MGGNSSRFRRYESGQGLVSYALPLLFLALTIGGVIVAGLVIGWNAMAGRLLPGVIIILVVFLAIKFLDFLHPFLVLLGVALHIYHPHHSLISVQGTARQAERNYRKLLHNRKIDVNYPTQLPNAKAYAPFVTEIFNHLLSNAIKYTPHNATSRTIEIYAEPLEHHVKYCVRDHGIGIASMHLPHVFNWFYRVRYGRTLGWGIGLSVVRWLVHQMDGECGVESQLGEGSIFWFTLPKG